MIINLVMAGATLWLVIITRDSVVQSQKQFIELNRPYVTLSYPNSDHTKLFLPVNQILVSALIKNVGKTTALNVRIDAYYNDNNGGKNTLINGADDLEIGLLYPDEDRPFLMKDPGLFVNNMKNHTYTLIITYNFLDKCITLNESFTINDAAHVRRQAPMEISDQCINS